MKESKYLVPDSYVLLVWCFIVYTSSTDNCIPIINYCGLCLEYNLPTLCVSQGWCIDENSVKMYSFVVLKCSSSLYVKLSHDHDD